MYSKLELVSTSIVERHSLVLIHSGTTEYTLDFSLCHQLIIKHQKVTSALIIELPYIKVWLKLAFVAVMYGILQGVYSLQHMQISHSRCTHVNKYNLYGCSGDLWNVYLHAITLNTITMGCTWCLVQIVILCCLWMVVQACLNLITHLCILVIARSSVQVCIMLFIV